MAEGTVWPPNVMDGHRRERRIDGPGHIGAEDGYAADGMVSQIEDDEGAGGVGVRGSGVDAFSDGLQLYHKCAIREKYFHRLSGNEHINLGWGKIPILKTHRSYHQLPLSP